MNKKYLLYFFPLFFSASINANAQGQYANEVDIKASYCLGASKPLAESTDKSDPLIAEVINLNNANYSRLQNFSFARVKSMNSAAINEISAAFTAGQEADKRSTLIIDACLKEVYSDKNISVVKWTKNLKDCRIRKQGESEVRRLEQCFDLDFLPY
jgi:hypothetical protein